MGSSEFKITYGRQNFEHSKDKVNIFSLPAAHGTPWRSKTAVSKHFFKVSEDGRTRAAADGFVGSGEWYHQTYMSHSDKLTILAIQLDRVVESACRANCVLHLVPNPDAPLIAVKARLTTNHRSVHGDAIAVFRGRAYVIGDELLSSVGINVSKRDRDYYMDVEELEDEFIIDTIEPAPTDKIDIISTPDGPLLSAGRRARKVRVRK